MSEAVPGSPAAEGGTASRYEPPPEPGGDGRLVPPEQRTAIRAMLEARHVAVVGASARPGSFGDRVLTELSRSSCAPEIHLVNPRYDSVAGLRCLPSLEAVPEPVDLVLLCVGDASLEEQLEIAASRGDRSAVIYGSAVDSDGSLRRRLAATARDGGMEVCGGGCMGFVNRVHGLRAIGYIEPHPLPAGPIALVTHSGSAFSALLRADRRLGWTLAVSSGQELVTPTSAYVDYALSLEDTGVVALLLETLRSPTTLCSTLTRCAESGVPVVALTVGGSPGGRAMVAAHSGALAGDDATWEALCDAYGVLRVRDLDEMADTLELVSAGRRARRAAGGHRFGGIATVHDSGAERALLVDVASAVGVGFAELAPATLDRLGRLLDPGLEPGNPLDVWGTGAGTRQLFARCLIALGDDPAVQALALCVDLVHELDGDTAYQQALLDVFEATTLPVALLTNLPSALDRAAARLLRDAGVPVLEGTRTGLLALRHLLQLSEERSLAAAVAAVAERQEHWLERLRRAGAGAPLAGSEALALVSDYGIRVPACAAVSSAGGAAEAAAALGYPVVLKTDSGHVAHKTEVGGVVLGLDSAAAVETAYVDLAARLGPGVLVMETAPPGVELALGVVQDPLLGPLVVVGAGGVLVEVLSDRAVGLPPIDEAGARRLLGKLAARPLLDGARGAPAVDLGAVTEAVVAMAALASELGAAVGALDVNPLRCSPGGAVALDALVVAR